MATPIVLQLLLFASPIAVGLWVAAIAMLVGPRLLRAISQRRAAMRVQPA